MDEIVTEHGAYAIDRATRSDVAEIVELLRDDVIGASREGVDLTPYLAAFVSIDADPAHLLMIVRDATGMAVGTMQLTLVPGLSRGGTARLIIEGVRVHSSARGSGLGHLLMEWAHTYGRERGAALAQLTSDKRRSDAHRFYSQLGYTASHEGFKLEL